MSRRRRTTPTSLHPAQDSMFPDAYSPLPRPPAALPGSLGCATRVAGLVAYGLDQARLERGRSRDDVAARMAAFVADRYPSHADALSEVLEPFTLEMTKRYG